MTEVAEVGMLCMDTERRAGKVANGFEVYPGWKRVHAIVSDNQTFKQLFECFISISPIPQLVEQLFLCNFVIE